MRVLLLVLLGWIATGAVARAECDCLWQGSFAEVQARADLVVSGTVARGKGNSVDLAVERTLRGGSDEPEIRVWLKTADYCRPEPELFPPGSEWVMALFRINEDVPGGFNPNTPNVSYGRVGDYSLSSCGGYWLSRSGDWVTGNLAQAPRWVREPKMTPVLLDLVADYVAGRVEAQALVAASREDPAVRQLMLDTKAFLRKEN
ncbi:MAG: delta-aminolevulinic acid dehydratase [Gammaproteobacteria bacterium]|nr:delta-aminolevulinic acid dehydratase [Gammaproteobacteria bacterium]